MSDRIVRLGLKVGTFKITVSTCSSLKDRKCFVVKCNNEVSCLLFVSGFVFQRLKFTGILQHHAWYSYQFTNEGKRRQEEINFTVTSSELFISSFCMNKE